ncbi:branched-chain amino acid ABC transporter permease [Anaerotruncus sp. AF02-27]|uniref:ABC transporter permease subunit n=1 Tax=Anaerotruncus sp. AF02-27 TaxID=2292191 RepID=UPI000E4AB6C7|nr:branched-chain amino acid ABC transporter permease [Anaerotruncus sp. AF02-27]RGX56950.1 branched-chain amino acid ABC transporter permease [Anaerotruncus sp. AF02-27]
MLNSIFNYFYQFLDSFSFLILAVAGLAIIFGMMGIINLAHGEFIMLGAYMFTILAKASVPLFLAVILGALFVGMFGYVVDKLVVSQLYGRPLDSVVATWGISLLLRQGILILMGPSLPGLTTPLGTFAVGESTYSVYRILLGVVAVLVLVGLYFLFMHTKFGLHSRATMQDNSVAQSLGINARRMYSTTFMLGSALAGLCGALYAPTMTITPTMGQAFQNDSFVTVIVGGADPLVGMALSGGVLGVIQSALSLLFGTFFGKMGLLVVAIIVIRVLPKGFSGLVEKHMVKGKR